MKELTSRNHLAKLGPLVRLDLFTDAVFAIVITLLSIEISLPHNVQETDLVRALLHMYPIFFAHIISFTVLGIEWIDHHSMFESARKCTRALMGSNLLFCLTLTSVPFLTKLLGYFPESKTAIMLYSMGILAMTLAKELIWQVISRQSTSVQPGRRRIKNGLALCVGVAASGIAMLYPKGGVIVWALFGIYSVSIRINSRSELSSENA